MSDRQFLDKWQIALTDESTDFELNFPWRVQAKGDKIVVFNTEKQADLWIASVRREIGKTL